jgi:cytochrome o ubiquinol oxidase subunit 2
LWGLFAPPLHLFSFGMHILKNFRRSLLLLPAMLLAGCNTVLMNPSGDIAHQQGRLIVVSTVLMLIIIIPVIALTIFFAWRYRQSNKEATYSPDWDHSTQLELAIWAAPLLIIIALGAITWISTHTLDPYQPLRRIDAQRAIPADTKPLVVEVVALDWKWLFIYPEQGIATVNELAAPVDRPIEFKITASSVMNSFFLNRCVDKNKMCMKQMMAIDADGGLGKPGAFNVATMQSWQPDTINSPKRKYVTAMCTTEE